mgnify:CR=1 FL=1
MVKLHPQLSPPTLLHINDVVLYNKLMSDTHVSFPGFKQSAGMIVSLPASATIPMTNRIRKKTPTRIVKRNRRKGFAFFTPHMPRREVRMIPTSTNITTIITVLLELVPPIHMAFWVNP